jgi:hypothetical protein
MGLTNAPRPSISTLSLTGTFAVSIIAPQAALLMIRKRPAGESLVRPILANGIVLFFHSAIRQLQFVTIGCRRRKMTVVVDVPAPAAPRAVIGSPLSQPVPLYRADRILGMRDLAGQPTSPGSVVGGLVAGSRAAFVRTSIRCRAGAAVAAGLPPSTQGTATAQHHRALLEHAVPRGATCRDMRELIYQGTADVASIRSGSAARHDLQGTAWRHEPVGG